MSFTYHDFRHQLLAEESMKYAEGFDVFQNHKAQLIDSPEKLDSLFYPFLDKNTEFGFDAEWEQSYSGDIGM